MTKYIFILVSGLFGFYANAQSMDLNVFPQTIVSELIESVRANDIDRFNNSFLSSEKEINFLVQTGFETLKPGQTISSLINRQKNNMNTMFDKLKQLVEKYDYQKDDLELSNYIWTSFQEQENRVNRSYNNRFYLSKDSSSILFIIRNLFFYEDAWKIQGRMRVSQSGDINSHFDQKVTYNLDSYSHNFLEYGSDLVKALIQKEIDRFSDYYPSKADVVTLNEKCIIGRKLNFALIDEEKTNVIETLKGNKKDLSFYNNGDLDYLYPYNEIVSVNTEEIKFRIKQKKGVWILYHSIPIVTDIGKKYLETTSILFSDKIYLIELGDRFIDLPSF